MKNKEISQFVCNINIFYKFAVKDLQKRVEILQESGI